MRADIHDGQEHERSIHGPDTEAQDQSPPSLTSGLQHTAGPYSWVMNDRVEPAADPATLCPESDQQSSKGRISRRASKRQRAPQQ
jgi:hypothetical protein